MRYWMKSVQIRENSKKLIIPKINIISTIVFLFIK